MEASGTGAVFVAGDDLVQTFQLERSNLRGRMVRLGGIVDRIVGRHGYPEPVARLLGELLVLAAGASGALKFDGVFSLQIKGDGPVSLMVADCTNDGGLRACATFNATAVAALEAPCMADLLGKGLLALTVDQRPAGSSYQGTVELTGDDLSACMNIYFRRSEQIPTGLSVAVEPGADGWAAGGIVLQRLPVDPAGHVEAEADEDWLRAMMLLNTVSAAELTDPAVSVGEVLYRLFHEEELRLFSPRDLRATCRCSHGSVAAMLSRFEAADLAEMKEEDGRIHVTCEFCSESYTFDDTEMRNLHTVHTD